MKNCTKCGVEKPLTDFHQDKRTGRRMARCKPCRYAECKAWRKSIPDYERARYRSDMFGAWKKHIRRKFGITPEVYFEMERRQSAVCAICRKPETRKRFDIDHCHNSKVIRGLLCSTCNRMIGYAKDSTETLLAAVEYLSKSQKSSSVQSTNS